MGTISIKKNTRDRRYPVPEIDGELVIDGSDPERIALVVRGEMAVDHVRVESESPRIYYPREYLGERPILLLLPAIAFALLLALYSPLVASSATGVLGSHTVAGIRLVVGVFYLLVGLYGTLYLYDDARHRVDTDWAPNPWSYLTGGALVLAAARLAVSPTLDAWIETPTAIAGLFVISLLLGSTVAGPIYFLAARSARSRASSPE